MSFNESTENRWDTYAGISFENICRDHAHIIENKAGYKNKMIRYGSYWQKPTKRKKGVQIDLIIECSDNTSLICECKWSRKRFGTDTTNTLLEKLYSYPNKKNHTLHPVLIASAGVSKNVASHNNIIVLTLEDFF